MNAPHVLSRNWFNIYYFNIATAIIQLDSKRWTQFRTSIFRELNMVYELSTIHLEEKILSFQPSSLEFSSSSQQCSSVSWVQNGYYAAQDFFAFVSSLKLSQRLLCSVRFNIQPPTRKSICRWNHQFEQIGCLCKGKSSGRPCVSEENVRRIQESF